MSKSSLHYSLISASLLLLALVMAACTSAQPVTPSPTEVATVPTATPTLMPILITPTSIPTSGTTPSPASYDPNLPDSWKTLPVIPETVSQRMKELYETGKTSGLNQNHFSKVGDCETYTDYFLAPFDLKPSGYRLGEYTSLKLVITKYAGSFSRRSLAAERGFSVASVLSPTWADRKQCRANETPLICEIRVYKPAIMLVMFGTNDVKNSSRSAFEKNLKLLLDFAIKNKVVPVLATKADNLEGDGSINAIIARVGYEYQVPVWNYWRAMQDLPGNGLEEDQIHLTYAQPFFDSPENMQKGWPVRNLTALQALEKVTQELEK